MSDRRKHTPRQKIIATEPISMPPASLDKLIACLAVDPVALLAEYGEAAQYVKQLAEIKWNEKIQWNMTGDAADSHRNPEYLIQLISREYPKVAKRLDLPLTEPNRPTQKRRPGANEGLKTLIVAVAKQNPTYSQRQICGKVDDICSRVGNETPLPPNWRKAGATTLVAAFDSSTLHGRVKKFISVLRKAKP